MDGREVAVADGREDRHDEVEGAVPSPAAHAETVPVVADLSVRAKPRLELLEAGAALLEAALELLGAHGLPALVRHGVTLRHAIEDELACASVVRAPPKQ